MADWNAALTDWLKPFVESWATKSGGRCALYMWRA